MSLYVDYKVAAPQKATTRCLSWSRASAVPILAVGTDDGQVNLYLEEGERLDDREILTARSTRTTPTALQWNPVHRLLAIGWSDGTVSMWGEQERMHRQDPFESSGTPIEFLAWSPDGGRLVAGSQNGHVHTWTLVSTTGKADRLYFKRRYIIRGSATHCLFLPNKSSAVPPTAANAALNSIGELPTAPNFFLFGGERGRLTMSDGGDSWVEKYPISDSSADAKGIGAIASMMYNESSDTVVVISVALQMVQLRFDASKNAEELVKVKLSGPPDAGIKCCWAGNGLLSTACHEPMIRLWDLNNDSNYVLNLADIPKLAGDRVTSVAFDPQNRILAAGTREGKIVMWRYLGGYNDEENAQNNWDILPPTDLGRTVTDVSWGPREGLLSVSQAESVSVLNETMMNRRMRESVAVIQLSADHLRVEMMGDNKDAKDKALSGYSLKTFIRTKGLDHTGRHLVVWNGKKAEVYEMNQGVATPHSRFDTAADVMCLHRDRIFQAVESRVEVLNLKGVVKQNLPFLETEGEPRLMDCLGDTLVVATNLGHLKLFSVAHESKFKQTLARRFEGASESAVSKIRSIRVSCDGKRVSILCDIQTEDSTRADPRIHVYDAEQDVFCSYDFGPNQRYPVSHQWDRKEPKLLACETKSLKSRLEQTFSQNESSVEVATLFATPESKLLLQDSFMLDSDLEGIMGIQAPYLHFITTIDAKALEETDEGIPQIKARIMRDFEGMENADDPSVRESLLTFSYNLTIGNLDEAYKTVKLIQSRNVWENMAKMCVKTKRLDVAEICLGQMQHARGAAAVRTVKESETESEPAIAMVAIQLGMITDAERLYQQAGRYDLLNALLQSTGQWQRALAMAEKHDRIHLRTTHYNYARHLEAICDVKNAVKEYEISKTHKTEVPRMMINNDKLIYDLQKYVEETQEPELLNWWAQYCESCGSLNKALRYYEMSKDYMSMVRLLCHKEQFHKAEEVVTHSNDPKAAYQIARVYEKQAFSLQDDGMGSDYSSKKSADAKIREAISYYARAQCFSHAIRLAREFGMDNELPGLALQSSSKLMVETAKYFEERNAFDKAVLLYHKGGDLRHAVDLCFRAELFDQLKNIAAELGQDSDPELLERCGDFFVQHGHFDKAVQLFINANKHMKALDWCKEKNIKMSEEMADRMTPAKSDDEDANRHRIELLNAIAKCCHDQGSYHLSCKMFTKAGDKLRAMKVLLKSGDTEKIIFFAGVSRQREIYILAANYLQNLDWHNDAEIMKSIIQFYTKAKAFDQLAGFYDACSQVEIDEYRDYEKALGALKESMKWMMKARADDKEERLATLQRRIQIVEKFVQARRLVKSDAGEMERLCHQLLDQSDVEAAIRVGDVFALLVEFYYHQGNSRKAYDLIEKMRYRNIRLSPYLDREIVEAIYIDMGVEADAPEDDAGEGDGIDEEIGGDD